MSEGKFSGIWTLLLLVLSFGAGASWWHAARSSGEESRVEQVSAGRAAVAQSSAPRAAEDFDESLTPQERSTVELFESASRSVVYITSLTRQRSRRTLRLEDVPSGTGSGFVWDDKGHIVTNFHVIRGANRATVTLADHTSWEAELVGYAPEKDLAVLHIEAPSEVLQPFTVGRSGSLRVGQSVLAIGNPFGLDQTLTSGIISALGREIESLARIPILDVIQTDAAINPGNSGGPLLDSHGRLIGVNTAIASPSGASAGIGFAIPVDTVKWVVPDLIEHGELRRPILGVEVRQLVDTEGALVMRVTPGSGADAAGIRPTYVDSGVLGDLIVAIDDTPVATTIDMLFALEAHEVGDTVLVELIRDGKVVKVPVELGEARR